MSQSQSQAVSRGGAPDSHAAHKALFERMRRCDFVARRDIGAVAEFEALLDEFAALPIDYSYTMIQGLHRAGGRQFTQMLLGSDMAYVALWTTPAAIAFVLKIQRYAFILFNSYTRRYTITIKRGDAPMAAARDADALPGPIPLARSETTAPPRRRRRGGRGRNRGPGPMVIKHEMSPLILPPRAPHNIDSAAKLNVTMAEIEELTRPAAVVAKKNWGDMLDESDREAAAAAAAAPPPAAADEESDEDADSEGGDMPELEADIEAVAATIHEAKK